MSTRNSQWSDSGTKQLNFGGGGGGGQAGRMEWVFGGALVVIIVGVIALLIYSQMGGSGPPVNTNPEIHLQCVNPQCGEVLVKMYKEFSEEDRQRLYAPTYPMPPGMEGPPRLKCEKCGAVMGRQVQCPYEDCKQWYLDPTELNYAAMDRVCPHCNRDSNAYWQQKQAEQQKK